MYNVHIYNMTNVFFNKINLEKSRYNDTYRSRVPLKAALYIFFSTQFLKTTYYFVF